MPWGDACMHSHALACTRTCAFAWTHSHGRNPVVGLVGGAGSTRRNVAARRRGRSGSWTSARGTTVASRGGAGGEPGRATPDQAMTAIRKEGGAAWDRCEVVASRGSDVIVHYVTRPAPASRVPTCPAPSGGECGRAASHRGAPAPTGDPSLSASDYRLVHGDAGDMTVAPFLSRAPAPQRTGHDDPRRRPRGRAHAAMLPGRLGSRKWYVAPAIQTSDVPPRHTSGGGHRNGIVAHRHVAVATPLALRSYAWPGTA